MKPIKIISIIIIALVITNLIAFALGLISIFMFWIIIIGAALIAFYIIPNFKEQAMMKK